MIRFSIWGGWLALCQPAHSTKCSIGEVIAVEGVEKEACYTNEWVFDIDYLKDYWWDVNNKGLKRLEIRFYPVEEGYMPPPL